MIDVQNSSLTLRSWRLDAGETGTTICVVLRSSVDLFDSEILSNMECAGFLLADSGGSGESQIMIVGSHHKSSTPKAILPLVRRVYEQRNHNFGHLKPNEDTLASGWRERELITGVGLSFASTHFPLGTGPLFSFDGRILSENDNSNFIGGIETVLTRSTFENVTSNSRWDYEKERGEGSWVWERVVGCSVHRSTNHDMGTALCGTRLGGNLACLNTSFSSCVRTPNSEIDIKHENITKTHIGRTVLKYPSATTSVRFSLCTFNSMTLTVSTNEGGSAINLFNTASSLTITQCFFHKCTCPTQGDDGGAVRLWDSRADCPVSLSSCSFTECGVSGTGGTFGGSLSCDSKSPLSISNCFFEKSKSLACDGAVSIWNFQPATLSNCAFVSCTSATLGGAMGVHYPSSIDFSFLQFRGCSSSGSADPSDVLFDAMWNDKVNTNTVKSCDSTSAVPRIYLASESGEYGDGSALVPTPSSTPQVTVKVTFSGNTATVTASANPAVKGTMGILLKGSNVPRLIHVQFGSASVLSMSGSAEVSSGVNGVLPEATYSLHVSSVAASCFVSSSVTAAISTLKDANTTKLVLLGINLGEGSYSMLIQNGYDTFNISLSRSDSMTLSGEALLHPLDTSERLEWETEYEVKKVMCLPPSSLTEISVPLSKTIKFRTPTEPARIMTARRVDLNSRLDALYVSFTASSLPNGAGTVRVKLRSIDMFVEGQLFIISPSECLAEFEVAWEEHLDYLSFGDMYNVESATINSVPIVIDSDLSFPVPYPPVITSFVLPSECSSDSFSISVEGWDLPSLETFVVALSSSKSFEITFHDDTTGTGTIKAGLPSEIQFNTTYSIESVTKEYDHVLFNQTSLKTPLGPTLETVSTVLNASNKNNVIFTLTGLRMMTGQHTLTFVEQGQSTPITVAVSIDTVTTGSGEEVVFGGSKLKYGTTYTISSLTSDTLHFALDGSLTFRTPDEPARLMKIKTDMDDGLNSTTLTLSSRSLTVGGKYEIKETGTPLSSSNTAQETTFSFTAASSTQNLVVLPLYPFDDAKLKYGHSYSVDWMKVVGGASILVETETCVFVTPNEPARICSCTGAVLNKDRSKVTITFEGRALTGSLGSIWVSFGGTFWKSSSTRQLSETRCEADFLVSEDQNEAHLEYEGEYVVCLKPDEPSTLFVDSGITVRIPAPPRVTSIDSVFVNSLQSMCKIHVRGTDFEVGPKFEVTLNDSIRFTVTFKTSTEGESEAVSIGQKGQLKHNTTYTLTEIKPIRDDGGLVLLSGTLSLTTKERTMVEVVVREGGSDATEECGTIGNPCGSVMAGWRVGEEAGIERVVVKIDESGGFGGRVVVGEKNLEIGGLFEGENELKVSSGDMGEHEKEDLISVSGGRIEIVGVTLCLPRSPLLGERRMGSVVSGFGECVVRSVVIVEAWKGEGVGIGLVSWLGGSLSVEQIAMEGVEMESETILVNCSSSKKDVSFEMAESRFIGVGTRNAELVRFSSKSIESHFEMRDCVFVSTQRVENGEVGDGMGVIVVETSQEKTEISKCVFSECGTVEGKRESPKKGATLVVRIGSGKVGNRKDVSLLQNVLVDSCVSWNGRNHRRTLTRHHRPFHPSSQTTKEFSPFPLSPKPILSTTNLNPSQNPSLSCSQNSKHHNLQ
ncbi:hypothetical protein BLNAU_8680 [Blattamonas nauphoetae]|uniref:Uncharacterized protein n=1 Tax=Blattamonas nauphoetae TaxID=2049346 RepID=A0ABQ9XXU4_9EUKA|nr:hypothetical protein BLNAU_8680 [Blattamonas nauphoetae]